MTRQDISRYIIREGSTVREAIRKIEEAGREIALYCEEERLVGIVTDSDIRRGILRGVSLEDPVEMVINRNYRYGWVDEHEESIRIRMRRDYIRQLPIINEDRQLVDIYFLSDVMREPARRSTPVIIMAGGIGSRLQPLTNTLPKPMLPVGGKPLLEIIIEQFKSYGFYNFLLSVNYQKEIIKNYFQDGSTFQVNIQYIEETKRLGTAGAIALAKEHLQDTFFVVNGDVLTKVSFDNFLKFHQQENSMLTLATVSHSVQIPYGVINMSGNHVNNLVEKPSMSIFINAGMYCINKEVINFIPDSQYFDMTQLIQMLLNENKQVSSFPIHEYWMDIGQLPDYKKANKDYESVFL